MISAIGGAGSPQRTEGMTGPGGPGGPMRQAMAGAAELLGMGEAELGRALRGGSTLAELGAQRGVSTDDLVAFVAQGLEAVGPPPGAEGVDATTLAKGIVDGTAGPGHGRPPSGPPPGGRPGERLDALTGALGMDAESLFAELEQGGSLSAIAQRQGVDSTRLHQLLTGPMRIDTAA